LHLQNLGQCIVPRRYLSMIWGTAQPTARSVIGLPLLELHCDLQLVQTPKECSNLKMNSANREWPKTNKQMQWRKERLQRQKVTELRALLMLEAGEYSIHS
jgi:hypothetical protein